MGGQTALNIASELAHDGSLERLGVELIGSDLDAIDKAEDRELFQSGLRVYRPSNLRSHCLQFYGGSHRCSR